MLSQQQLHTEPDVKETAIIYQIIESGEDVVDGVHVDVVLDAASSFKCLVWNYDNLNKKIFLNHL